MGFLGVVVGYLDTSFGIPGCRFGFLGRHFRYLACSRVVWEINKIVHFFLNTGTRVRPCMRTHKTHAHVQEFLRVIRGTCALLLSMLAIQPRGSPLPKQEHICAYKGACVFLFCFTPAFPLHHIWVASSCGRPSLYKRDMEFVIIIHVF